MKSHASNNIKLGVFVIAALTLIIVAFYILGKNQSLFGANFQLRVHFSNLSGLKKGNNVLYSGIQAGTVKDIAIINDTTIQVQMLIKDELKPFIHKNAQVSIGTEGLMGNKIVQIVPVSGIAPLVADGDLLNTQKGIVVADMLQTISRTNDNISHISEMLKASVLRINNSELLDVLQDKATAEKLNSMLTNIHQATINVNQVTGGVLALVNQTKQGKGAAGMVLTDTAFASGLNNVVLKLNSTSTQTDALIAELGQLVETLRSDVSKGPGLLHALLKDTVMVNNLRASLINIEKGTDGFNQNMEALKHNFLLRGYFKKVEREERKRKTEQTDN